GVSPAGDSLWFISDRPGGMGSWDVYEAPIQGGVLGAPQLVAPVNSSAMEYFPALSPDGLTLWFSSSRADVKAAGGMDVWMSTRTTPTSPFSPPTIVQELNSAGDDTVTWLSHDGCRLYMTSNRSGNYDILMAVRSP